MNRPTGEKVEKAKEVLKQAGYFVDNLWQIADVHTVASDNDYIPEDFTDEECYRILQKTVDCDYIKSLINEEISSELDDLVNE